MSDYQTPEDRKPDQSKPSRDLDAFAVRQSRDGKGYFHKIGAAFAHKDGEGYDLDLIANPTNGRVTLRTPKERLDELRRQDDGERPEDEKDYRANKGKIKSRSRRRSRDKERGR